MSDAYGGVDARDIPTYPIVDAARYVRIPVGTLRSWIYGRSYLSREGKQYAPALIELPKEKVRELSFTNLVEAHVLRIIRLDHRISLAKVRTAIDYISEQFNLPHPLARVEFQTDGKDLFVDKLGGLIAVSKDGQLAMREMLGNHLKRIELDEAGRAAQLFPFTGVDEEEAPKIVVVNPKISFGRLVLVGTGIPTAILAERYKAGESINSLAEDYEINSLQVEEAIRCELPLAA